MAAGEVSVVEDGGHGHVKLHPYLVTLVRWCVSCLWSTATLLLHRLMTTPLPPIMVSLVIPASKALPKPPKQRAASSEHLHPEPRVECEVLHTPEVPTLDVIFVHGLYGSLGNTWRQGEWRPKYKTDLKKVSLRDHNTFECNCRYTTHEQTHENVSKFDDNHCFNSKIDVDELSFEGFKDNLFKKILPNENSLITEQFYNNTLLDQVEIIDNYESQAKFVQDLFNNENNCEKRRKELNKTELQESHLEIGCKCETKCEVGCGCLCDKCYSNCWPKDWIKEDFPGARVISINYTSDPYLWRPLWVKQIKRLRLQERAEQMIQQLLDLGVGKRPIIWVGHSKGGLFIKQIYCEAYDAYLKLNNESNAKDQDVSTIEYENNKIQSNEINRLNSLRENLANNNSATEAKQKSEYTLQEFKNNIVNSSITKDNSEKDDNIKNNLSLDDVKNANIMNKNIEYKNDDMFNRIEVDSVIVNKTDAEECGNEIENDDVISSTIEEDLRLRASLWKESNGFMFYSVPHRGSPLADIKTPITARSVELLEISKDCSLVLGLQARWLAAAHAARPAVRGAVETGRTLMSVLWLRIVSVDSADAGIGSLVGVSVDHREICKPSSRRCALYCELVELIRAALYKCQCH